MSNYILGGGMTGLSAGIASGLPIFEAVEAPGGICSSYYVRPGEREHLMKEPEDGEVYHFEIGGGHWIFGGDPTVLHFINSLTPVNTYARRSSVYFHEKNIYVPYPLQNHLRYLDQSLAAKALAEMATPRAPFSTMEQWMEQSFGPSLCELFFYPFHELYTAGLYKKIAPQDAYKSPVNLSSAIQGALNEAPPVGYNVTFVYPNEGLNTLAQRMAERCDVRYGKRAAKIDVQDKTIYFTDGSAVSYNTLISTLPLNTMLDITGLEVDVAPDPYTSVLVLNIGAEKGDLCPEDHWLYNPDAKSGFHRVGFYSNVAPLFLPKSSQSKGDRVSIYVERAFVGGTKPSEQEVAQYCDAVVKELQSWGYIKEAEVVDPTWIEVAYTWSYPGSKWKPKALQILEDHDIYQIGRYGRWIFQGIADSLKDGFFVGASFKQ
ncbi:Protoporphyrinogen oxidase-like protein [Gloeothece citriformis PCC 7424]|uniref:Protoporphyrinogen oxidase-like protein n=1 Tax=Gloeothece citriformis (strain PCC 7424) TaxID=65393 RepID=B7KBX4_GLOC7|nr:FAD-dependent oxidoreductase [Gloeothece citriformis]ACK68797.1 Protoporphyrinogen oxidase-like protein [Gloeothece citriformis PCC 7424]